MRNLEIAIIGGGPAGITAAVQAVRCGANVAVFERERLGGLIRYANLVENYPGLTGMNGSAAAEVFANHARHSSVRVVCQEVKQVGRFPEEQGFVVETNEATWHATAVIFAAGTRACTLAIPGSDQILSSVESTLDFAGKSVAIIGGGDAALDQALRLSRYASSITILARGDFHALPLLVNKCLAAGVKLMAGTGVQSSCKAGSVYILQTCGTASSEITADRVIAFVGREPNLEALSPALRNRIPAARGSLVVTTSVAGFYLAGDLIAGQNRQLAIATGTGMLAALEAVTYLTTKKV
ncbi:MAG: NAD(P)/FAD-dependent oxidoreductase [Anaerolineae bacterium]